jgi:aspartate racemase
MAEKTKTVGVLGGMGPHATAAFFQTLLNITPAKKDWDHLRVIIDDNPHIPSRTRHLLHGEPSPVPGMLESCRRLERYPVDLIALPCNSAAVFIPQLRSEVGVPILNIIEITANALASNHAGVERVAVLGGYVTYKMQSYKPFLEAHGNKLVDHDSEIQEQIERQIESLKLGQSNDSHREWALSLTGDLKTKFDAQAIIFACTEFGCLPKFECDMPVIDSSLELARHTLQLARS